MQGRVRVASLVITDMLCVFFAWAATVVAYWCLGFGDYDPAEYVRFWPVALLFVVFNMLVRLYHGNVVYPSLPLGPVEEFRRLVASSVTVHLIVMAFLGFSRQQEEVSRFVLIASGLLLAGLSQPFRDVARWAMKRFGIGSIPCFIVGSGDLARQIVQECENSAFLGCRVVGSFDDGGKSIPGVERLGGLRDVVRMGRAMDVKRLLACYDERLLKEQLTTLVRHFQFIDYFPTRRAFPVIGSRLVAVGGFGGIELVNQSCMKALRWEKVAMDFLLSVAAIFVCLPLFILIPVLIKLTSRGPVFYRHHRLGKGGRTIKIWKFRSMYMDAEERLATILENDPAARAEWEENFKLKNDPRITPFGRFLRKTSLDEIPQLFNVLLGEMAIVGPRPIVEDEVRYYGGRYELFSRAKPGITGLWQVSGRSDTGYDRRVSLDCYYVLNWNPWMDLWVIMRTVSCVLLMRGAH